MQVIEEVVWVIIPSKLYDDNISGDIINKFTRYYTSIGYISYTPNENIEFDW